MKYFYILITMADELFKLHTKKEASVKGAYLERPEKFDIMALIEDKMTIKNAKSSLLITYKELVNALSGRYSETSIHKTLIELKLDNLIAVVPGISFSDLNRKLTAESFIICRPEKKSYDISDVYNELIEKSAEAIIAFAKEGYDFNRDAFWKDLESSMLEDENSEVFFSEIYFSIDSILQSGDFELSFEQTIYNRFKLDVIKVLALKRKVIEFFNHRIFLISPGNLEEVSRTLTAFFSNRILPQFENISVVARELDVIQLQEEMESLESNKQQHFNFTAAKAYVVQKYFEEEKYKKREYYPGRILFTLIHELEKFISEFGEKQSIEFVYNKFVELKNIICNRDKEIVQPIYFFTENDIQKFPLESVEKVQNERTIVSTTWERRSGTVYVFMEMTSQNFNDSLDLLKKLPSRDLWKILAFRKLLQDSQKIKADINPFNDPVFHKNYSLMLNNAYQCIVPFYYNFFLWIQIGFIQNMVYQRIKKLLVERQKTLAEENQHRRFLKKQQKFHEVTLKKKLLKRLLVRNRILEELDFFYFKQNLIPSVGDIKERFPDIQEKKFMEIIREFEFLLIPTESLVQSAQKILYYPKSVTWGYNLEKIKSNIELWLRLAAESKLTEEDQTLVKRFHALNLNLQLV